MSKISLTSGISGGFDEIFGCFNPIRTHYIKGETIADFSDITPSTEKIGILLAGKAYLYCTDMEGHFNLTEVYGENDLFGKIFLNSLENLEYMIVAKEECDVLYLDYFSAATTCEKNCKTHCKLLSNLLRISVHKAEQLSLHTNILSQRTIRGKLLSYLKYISGGKSSFTIPLQMSELADYLCIDRCAMLRELKNMRLGGLLTSKGRNFTFPE